MTSDDAWLVAMEDNRVPEAIMPMLFAVRELKAKERVFRTMES